MQRPRANEAAPHVGHLVARARHGLVQGAFATLANGEARPPRWEAPERGASWCRRAMPTPTASLEYQTMPHRLAAAVAV